MIPLLVPKFLNEMALPSLSAVKRNVEPALFQADAAAAIAGIQLDEMSNPIVKPTLVCDHLMPDGAVQELSAWTSALLEDCAISSRSERNALATFLSIS